MEQPAAVFWVQQLCRQGVALAAACSWRTGWQSVSSIEFYGVRTYAVSQICQQPLMMMQGVLSPTPGIQPQIA